MTMYTQPVIDRALTVLDDSRSAEASTDLSSKPCYFAKEDGSDTLGLCGNTEHMAGIIYDGGRAAGDQITLIRSGPAEVILGGTVAAGDQLGSDANGAAVAHTTDNGWVGAVAREPGVSGDVIRVDAVVARRY